MQITVELPDDLARQIIPAGSDPSRTVLEDLAVEAFRARRLTDLLLMDERAGVDRRLGLTATGTLGILTRGAERGFIRLGYAFEKPRQTNFRVRPEILQELRADYAKGRQASN